MAIEDRKKLFLEVEKIRNIPLISYITSTRPNAGGLMASDVIYHFIRQVEKIPDDQQEIDVLVVSNGGDPTVAWRINSLLRERFEKVNVLLPNAAFSAATLLALGANEIYMHPFANLGPVDPQLKFRKVDEKGQNFDLSYSAEDLSHFLDFVRSDVGISDQEQLEKAFEFICRDIGAIPIGITKKSKNLTYSMGEKLLQLHMLDQNKVKIIIEKLNTSFYHHGYPVGRKEAIEIGLPIIDSNKELDSLIWEIWKDIEIEMNCNIPYNPLEIVLNSSEGSKLVSEIPQINLPVNLANLPPQLLQPVLQNILQQIIPQIKIEMIQPIEVELLIAVLESSRCRSEFKMKEKILPTRLIDTNIRLNRIPITEGWVFYENY